jgi:hypothetical protein
MLALIIIITSHNSFINLYLQLPLAILFLDSLRSQELYLLLETDLLNLIIKFMRLVDFASIRYQWRKGLMILSNSA